MRIKKNNHRCGLLFAGLSFCILCIGCSPVEGQNAKVNDLTEGAAQNEAAEDVSTQASQRQEKPSSPEDVRKDPGTLTDISSKQGEKLQFNVTGSVDGSVWGTDVYTSDSQLAVAAVHSGVLKPGQSGIIQVTLLQGQSNYASSNQNGVQSSSFDAWGSSYRIELVALTDSATTSNV